MKKRAFFLPVMCLLVVTLMRSKEPQQRSYSEKELISMWEQAKKKYPPSQASVRLECEFSFPLDSEKEGYFGNARDITDDPQGNIYVSDPGLHKVLCFNSLGNYLKSIGRKGQGPGEFNNPASISIGNGSELMVNDNDNSRVQLFDRGGNLKNSLKTFRGYMEMAISPDGDIYGLPLFGNPEQKLIDVISNNGRNTYSFGESLKYIRFVPANMAYLAVSSTSQLYVAFKSFPIVRKYGKSGDLLFEHKIERPSLREFEENNRRILARNKESAYDVSFVVTYGIRATEGGYYLLLNYPYLEIIEFSDSGRLLNEYWAVTSYDYRPAGFICRMVNRKPMFYVLSEYPENRVDVFRPATPSPPTSASPRSCEK